MKIGPSHTEVQFNRAIIQKDQHKQLVYYWFQQRGRYIANEYLVKWYLLKDSIFNNRSDGSLVRLVTPIATNETEETADQRLLQFSNEVAYQLKNYLPN
jgi:EpsI family protein